MREGAVSGTFDFSSQLNEAEAVLIDGIDNEERVP
jgi:hypothetical protein